MFDLLGEVFRELKADRFRTLLSLLGVAVGIFSIVSALTLVDSIKTVVQESFAVYGSDILYIEREPIEPDLNEDGVFRWWAYADRPPVGWRDYRYLTDADVAEGLFARSAFAAYGNDAVGVAGDWTLLIPQTIAAGRGFSKRELEEACPYALSGAENGTCVGEKIWIDGARYEIIGVFEKAGATTVSPVDVDRVFLIPWLTMRGTVLRSSVILADADETAVRTRMRSIRRLRPGLPDDFSFNRLSFLLEEMNDLFSLVARVGWLVGLFSLLAGGIGIANMMLVSVQERRPRIGICRALGARRRTIRREFLGEGVVLSLLGAIAGILMVILTLSLIKLSMGVGLTAVPLRLSARNISIGLLVAILLGLVFGAYPAGKAANLTPVKAINGK